MTGGETTSSNGPDQPYTGNNMAYGGQLAGTTVTVTLGGVTPHGSDDTMLQGQRCTASPGLDGVCSVPNFPQYSHGGDVTFSRHDWFVHDVVYRSPGATSKYTPLAYVSWEWNLAGSSVHGPSPSGNVRVNDAGDTTFHPEWEAIHN